MRKKIQILFLIVCMMLSCIPSVAFAAIETHKVSDDSTVTETVENTKSVDDSATSEETEEALKMLETISDQGFLIPDSLKASTGGQLINITENSTININ